MLHWIGIVVAGGFGAIFGSYATLFAHRLPLGESCFGRYFGKKSHCPNCGNVIRTRELIPLFNWLFTRGKCSKCQVKIPRSHFFIELSCTILFILAYLKFSFSELFILYSLTCCGCVILAVTDLKNKKFPYQILVFLLLLSVASRVLIDGNIIDMIFSATYGVLASVIFYQIFFKKVQGIFANQDHFLDYVKFMIIAAIFLQRIDFALYFLTVLVIFSSIILFNAVGKRRNFGYGFGLIMPFLWLILI